MIIPLFKLQSGDNLQQIVTEVRTICNLMSGFSTDQLEEAIGAVKRVRPMILVGVCLHIIHTVIWSGRYKEISSVKCLKWSYEIV